MTVVPNAGVIAPASPGEVTPRQRWTTVGTVVLSCCHVVVLSCCRLSLRRAFARFSFGLLLPAMKRDLGISFGLAGWLGTIPHRGGVVHPALLAAMMLAGLGGAATWVPSPSVAASVFPAHRRGFAMGCRHRRGIVVAVAMMTVVRSAFDDPELWRPIWAIEATIGVAATICALIFLRPISAVVVAAPKLAVLRQVPRWWSATRLDSADPTG